MTLPAGATQVSPPFGFGAGEGVVPVPSPIARGVGGERLAIPRALYVFPPEIYPIPEAQIFNPLGSTDTTVAETRAIPGASVKINAGFSGIIRGVVFYVDNILTTSVLSFSVLVDGVAAQGFGNVVIFPRNAPSVSNSFDAFIRVPQNAQLVTVTFTNGDGGSYKVGAALSGWQWPTSSGDRWISTGY